MPASNWTMHARSDQQVPVKNNDNKRQYTAQLACSLARDFFPPYNVDCTRARTYNVMQQQCFLVIGISGMQRVIGQQMSQC